MSALTRASFWEISVATGGLLGGVRLDQPGQGSGRGRALPSPAPPRRSRWLARMFAPL